MALKEFQPVQQADVYGQAGRRKAIGYPMGKNGRFLDGRLLVDAEPLHFVARVPVPGASIVAIQARVLQTPKDRAAYLYSIEISTNDSLPPAAQLYQNPWQWSFRLFTDGRQSMHTVGGAFRSDIGLYLPPDSYTDAYIWLFNPLGAAPPNIRYFNLNGYAVTFDSRGDAWEWGRGSKTNNPAIGTLTWP